MVDVFISYSRNDLEAVTQLANAITDAGYSVWWDAELPPHKSYGEVITEKIESAKAAVVVWSPTARESEWVRAEADMARSHKKLIQTALGDIMPPLPFNQIQFADLGDWKGEDDHNGWMKVKESLADLCGEREAGASAAATSAAPEAVAATPAKPASPAPTPTPSPAPEQAEAASGPPPGSVEYYRGKKTPLPLVAGLGGGAMVLAVGGVLVASAMDDSDDYSDTYDPITLPEPADPLASNPAPPVIEPAPPATSSYPTTAQTFSGSLAENQTQSFTIGLNAGMSYMIVGQCDLNCTDIDMWLYDENGNQIDEDVLEDDYPVLEVTPQRSAQFRVEIQMFACQVSACSFEITSSPL